MKFTGSPTGGTFTIAFGGQSATYSHDHKLLTQSDPYVEWALQWAQKEADDE